MKKIHEISEGLMVCTPMHNGQAYSNYINTCLEIKHWALTRWKINTEFGFLTQESSIGHARNLLVKHFLESECSHMLFMDADNAFPGEYLEDMLRLELDVLGLPCAKKKLDWERVKRVITHKPTTDGIDLAYASVDLNVNFAEDQFAIDFHKPLEVLRVGTGVMLIHRRVFEQYRKHHGETLAYKLKGDTFYNYFEESYDEQKNRFSEDFTFCNRWRAAGGSVHILPYIPTVHEGNHVYEMNMPFLVHLTEGLPETIIAE